MNELFGLIHELSDCAVEIGRVAAVKTARAAWIIVRYLRTATRLAIAWPFVLLLAAMLSGKYWPVGYIVPGITIAVLLVFLWMATRLEPLAILTTEVAVSPDSLLLGKFVEKAREATNAIRIVLGLEVLTGIYFSIVPIANDRRLALILVLVVAAAICFVGIQNWKPAVIALGVAFCVITIIFWLRGKDNHLDPNQVFAARAETSTSQFAQSTEAEAPSTILLARPKTEPSISTPAPPVDPPQLPPEKTVAPILPISGNEGQIYAYLTGCRFIYPGEVGCEGWIQNRAGIESIPLRLADSYGVDDQGEDFQVWLANGGIKFKGGGFMTKLTPGMPEAFEFHFAAPHGTAHIGFHLELGDTHGRFWEEVFAQVPVSAN
jgi:hypothetical protein